MNLHWSILARLLSNPLRTVAHDDRRAYRAIDLVVAAAHVADAVDARSAAKAVGLLMPTSGAFGAAALGLWSLGRAVLPLNYLLKPDELQYVIDDAGLDTIVASRLLLERLELSPRVENLVILEDIDFKRVPSPRLPALTPPAELAALIYTSGTSGKPKGVMLTHRALLANANQGADHFHFTTSDTMLGVLPQFHAYGLTQLTITPLLRGVGVVYTARFIPKKIIELVKKQKATVLVGIPSMFNALAAVKDARPEDLASLRLVVSGAEPLPTPVFDKFRERFGHDICEGYGMTEMGPATHANLPETNRPGTVGHALPGITTRIVDAATDRDLPPGVDGEIRLCGPNLMNGYYNLPDETARSFDPSGCYRTGDMGRLEHDGVLRITGRIKEMMIVAGENVFPREIEEVLDGHPKIHASAAIGQPDGVRGEVPVAYVELCPNLDPEGIDDAALERELIALCRERLAGYKAPRKVIRVHALPRNPTGKILRKELRARPPAVPMPDSFQHDTAQPASSPAKPSAAADNDPTGGPRNKQAAM